MSKRVSRSPRAHKRQLYIKRSNTKLVDILRSYNIGQKVLVKLDSAVHKSMPFPRILNRVGEITAIHGKYIDKIYTVKIDKKYHLIYSAHLRHATV